MKYSYDFSTYMSCFCMNFKKAKFLRIFAQSNEKFTFPHKSIMIAIGSLMVLLFCANIALCIYSWLFKHYFVAILLTIGQALFTFSFVFEPIILKKKILRNFQGSFYILTMLFYSTIFNIFSNEILIEYGNSSIFNLSYSELFEILSILFGLYRALNWYVPSLCYLIIKVFYLCLLLSIQKNISSISFYTSIFFTILMVLARALLLFIMNRGMKISFLAQYFLSKVG